MKRQSCLIAIAILLPVVVSGVVLREGRHPGSSLHEVRPATVPVTGEMGEEDLKQTSWWAEVQENIRRTEYEISRQEKSVIEDHPGGLHAVNRAQNLRAYFRKDSVQVLQRTGDPAAWEWRWELSGYGRNDGSIPVGDVEPTHENTRVEYDRSGITEWYENTEEGVEQGFTVSTRPVGTGELVIEGRVEGGLRGVIDRSGEFIRFLDKNNVEVLRYGDLVSCDATGKSLPAKMLVAKNTVRLVVDDAQAAYPITIDPLLTTPSWTAESDDDHALFGWSVSGAGDIDGDGYADVIVGAYEYDISLGNEGRAYVYSGSASGLSLEPAWTVEGEQQDGYFGWSVSGAGDVNGDGYGDVIVGEQRYDNGQTYEGRALVYHGSASGLTEAPVWTEEGEQAGAFFGHCVSGAGDVNGDGYADVIIGAPQYKNPSTMEGAAYVYLGSESGLLTTPVWTDEGNEQYACFGYSVSCAGDVNGDGYSDVIIGAPAVYFGTNDASLVYVYHGRESGLSSSPDWTSESDQANASFGHSVSDAGDVDGDGYADVIIGAYRYDDGEVFVYYGSSTGLDANGTRPLGTPANADWTAESDQTGADFGHSVSGAGDVNGDGYADVIVGAPYYENGQYEEGGAFVYHGSSTGLDAHHTRPNGTLANADWMAEGNQPQAPWFAWSVSGAGDVNGDGYADVIIGAPTDDNGESNEGRARVFCGSGSGLSTEASWFGESDRAHAFFGWSVSGAGDVNGDGYADAIVGAKYYSNGEADEGAVFVYHGSESGFPTTPDWSVESNQENAFLGSSVSGAGDVNGDGYADVIVCAYKYDCIGSNEGRVYVYNGSPGGVSSADPWIEDGSADHAYFGYSVSGAGDVNGDGYADVVIGEYRTDRVHVYYGSADGVSRTDPEPSTLEGGQSGSCFGACVSGAGDVNGDGYADVVIGALDYDNGETDEGAAFVYHGSPLGVSETPAWTAEGDQQEAQFGGSVSGAGDVNGDGYADVVIGALDYDNGERDEGAAFVYHGSSTGLDADATRPTGSPANADWAADCDQADALFGHSVSGAGDVNGDGFADVIVGAYEYDNGDQAEGLAYVYVGSAAGLSTMPQWTDESDQNWADFGYSVSGAGDVNGDGYADIIVGDPRNDNGEEDVGRASVYYGNGGGMTFIPRQARADGTAPVGAGCMTGAEAVRLKMLGRTPMGRTDVKLEWEVKPYGTPFDGTDTGMSTDWADTDTAGVELDEFVSVLGLANGYRWRMRLLYHPAQSPHEIHSPWYSPQWPMPAAADFRTSAYLPPTMPGVQVTPDSPTTTDHLKCEVTEQSTVYNDLTAYYCYTWSNGTRTVENPCTEATSDTLDSSFTSKHETWTCSVVCEDGIGHSHLPVEDSTTVINTPPEPPEITLPPEWPDKQNLVCQVVECSDDDGDAITYTFDWEYDRGTGWTAWTGTVMVENLYSQINNEDTLPDDTWRCTVTSNDDDGPGGLTPPSDECTILSHGIIDSSISLTFDGPNTVRLGGLITVKGAITPPPTAAAVVSFESESPSEDAWDMEFPPAVGTDTDRYSTMFYPDEASEGRDEWKLKASWPGDDTHRPATSDEVTFTVNKARPMLTLELSASAVPTGLQGITDLTAMATLIAPIPSHLSDLLEGRTIKLFWRDPDGHTADDSEALQATTVVETSPTGGEVGVAEFDLLNSGIDFSIEGTWTFQANLDEDDNFKRATSPGYDDDDAARLIVKDSAGYAIIVLGKAEDEAGHREHGKTTDYVYRTLRARAFHGDLNPDITDIYYLREVLLSRGETIAEGIHIHDTSPTKPDVQNAIETWAYDKICASPAPLYVIFLDHGGEGKFHLFSTPDGDDSDDYITPEELAMYFYELQSKLEGVGGEAAEQDVVFIYGACRSGSFIPAVSGERRVIIASCGPDEVSHRGVIDPSDGIREGEAFATELFRNASTGKTLEESFELAEDSIAEYIATQSNSGDADRPQHPVLDDPSERADQLVLGFGENEGGSVGWLWAAPAVIDADEPLVDLEARADREPLTADYKAWVEIKTPDYSGSTPINSSNPDSQEMVEMPGIFHNEAESDLATGTFKWLVSDLTSEISEPGTYKVFYYLMDPGTGPGTEQTSSYLLTTIYVGSSQPPDPVTLVHPDDGAVLGSMPVFVWEETTDPDGDAITYRLEISEDNGFPEGATIVKEGLLGNAAVATMADGIQDLRDYYWRVVPVDEYGSKPASTTFRTFSTDFLNPVVSGCILGMVTDKRSGTPIVGATITVTPEAGSKTSNNRGHYLFATLSPQTYTVGIVAEKYEPQSTGNVKVEAGEVEEVRFQLVPENVAPVCTEIPDVSFEEDSSDTSIDLDGHVSDVDHTDAELSWTYSGATHLTVSIDPTTHVVTLGAVADWHSAEPEEIMFTCTDPGELSCTTQVNVTVESVNDPPVCTPILEVSFDEDATDTSIDLDDYVSDVDHTDAELSWTYSDAMNVTISIDPTTHVVTLGAVANWHGTESITFTCTDPGGLLDTTQVSVTVNSVNDAPWIDPAIPDLVVDTNAELTYNLTGHEHDVEDSDSGLVWSVNGLSTSLFNATIDPSIDELTVTPVRGTEGIDEVQFVLQDSDGATVSQWVTVTVSSETQPKAVLTVGSGRTQDNDAVTVAVTLGPVEAEVAEIEFTFVINSQVVKVESIVAGAQANAVGKTVKVSQMDADHHYVTVGGNISVLADGEVVRITLRAAESDGGCRRSSLDLQDLACYDANGAAIIPIVGVGGHFCLDCTSPNIDCSTGPVDAIDVQLVINATLGIDVPWDCDVNGDGFVNALDVQIAINAALGMAT